MSAEFSQSIDLYLNVRGRQFPAVFFTNRNNTSAAAVQLMHGDAVLLRFWLCEPPTAFGRAASLVRANGPIAFALKASASASAALLAFASDFTLVDSSPEQDGTQEHYEAVLNLATAQMNAAFTSAATTSIQARLDVEMQSQGNTRRITFASNVQIVREAYQGTEVTPVPSTPAYPAPGDIPSKNEIDNLITAKTAAQLPALVNAAVSTAVAAAIESIPRITRAAAATLQPGADATAAVEFPDPDDPDANPASGLLSIGVPRGVDGVVTGVPPTFTAAAATVPSGADAITVTFAAAFAAAPNVTASLVAPSGDAPVIAFVLRAITATGFTVSLAAPAPASGYIITYTAISTAS